MKALLHPALVNGRTGDPALYLDFQFERRAMLFDIGDLHPLTARKLLRVTDVFVSHGHLDHFIGFDQLARLSIGRAATVRIHGPEGMIDKVAHKLAAYDWNLAGRYGDDLVFEVREMTAGGDRRGARMRLWNRFLPEPEALAPLPPGRLVEEPSLRVDAVTLDHFMPCLAFALTEERHVNVWRNRVEGAGLPIGPWLAPFKRAIAADAPDETPIEVDGLGTWPLGALRHLVSVENGQKIGYVTDIVGSPENIEAAARLVAGADVVFVETAFAAADATLAAERGHLTTAQGVEIARRAGAGRIEPFHFSPRYSAEGDRLLDEVREMWGDQAAPSRERSQVVN